jgi:ribose 5-phosphate isomerase RpiB
MLEELRRAGGEIRLAKDALLTPAARDWLKEHAVPVTWEAAAQGHAGRSLAVVMDSGLSEMRPIRAMLERTGGLAEVIEPVGGRSGVSGATRRLCGKIARREAAKGVVFAQDGALAACIASKHRGIRAALGCSVPMVEEACRQLGINLLVIEYPRQTTWQIRQMIERLVAGPTSPPAETAAMLEAIEQSGGKESM